MDQRTKWQTIVDDLDELTFKGTNSGLFKTYQAMLTDIKRQAKGYLEEYETLSFAKRLEAERLLNIGEQIKNRMITANKAVTKTITQATAEHATNGYYGTFYALDGAENINIPVALLDEKYILQLVTTPVDGKKFSQRLYKNIQQLAEATQASLTLGAVDGKGYAYVAKRIEDLTESNYKRALRIARTEGGRVSSLATQRAYRDAKTAGVDMQKRWLSTLDKKTRHSHQELDGQTVDVDDNFVSPITGAKGKGPRLLGRASEDINCRCTTIAVVNGISPELRRDNETGETIQNMTYKEWMESKGMTQAPKGQIPPVVAKPKAEPKPIQKPEPKPAPTPAPAPEPKPTPSQDIQRRGHLRRKNETEARDTIAKELNVSTAKAEEYRETILGYSGTEDYTQIRDIQRKGIFDPEFTKKSDTIEEYIDKAPKWQGGTLYRGAKIKQSDVAEIKVGTVLNQGGTSSWTDNLKVANRFAKISSDTEKFKDSVSVIFKLDETNQGTSVRHISRFFAENEVLVSNKAKQVVSKIEIKQKGKQMIVHLVEMED